MCGGGDHVDWKCPELVAPIRQEGMMKPPAGQPVGGDDDDSLRQRMRPVKDLLIFQQGSLSSISMPPTPLLPVG